MDESQPRLIIAEPSGVPRPDTSEFPGICGELIKCFGKENVSFTPGPHGTAVIIKSNLEPR